MYVYYNYSQLVFPLGSLEVILILSLTIIILAGNSYIALQLSIYVPGLRYELSLCMFLLDAGGTVVINSEQNNTLICPGESLHYSCLVPGNISITWSVLCPGQRQELSESISLTSTQTEDKHQYHMERSMSWEDTNRWYHVFRKICTD